MASLFTIPPIPQVQNPSTFDVAQAVQRGELVLSVSTMLGSDYIFVSHKGAHELLRPTRIQTTIRELLDLLETSPYQSMVITADELQTGQLVFTRYEYQWENRQVVAATPTLVTDSDQADFTQMMFDCSTTY
jgi:reverse gyrase